MSKRLRFIKYNSDDTIIYIRLTNWVLLLILIFFFQKEPNIFFLSRHTHKK